MAGLVRTLRQGDAVKVNGVTFTIWKIVGGKAVVQTDAPKEMEIRIQKGSQTSNRGESNVREN